MTAPLRPLFESDLKGLELLSRGKVRDMYAVGEDRLLIVTSDRLSAFDVVLPDCIPGKGQVLNEISAFWFAHTGAIVANHLTEIDLSDVLTDEGDLEQAIGRSAVVRKLRALPIEAVVRGYLIGSGWKDYQRDGKVCGIALPDGLRQAERLPEPIFTPATKAAPGEHDENITFRETASLIGAEQAARVRDTAIALYQYAADHAHERGIIVADTKFEFGLDDDDNLLLIDEVVTPDSSRFWPADSYQTGISPPSFDKQFVRDYLSTLDWDKTAPGPGLPAEVIAKTSAKYRQALDLLTAEL